jgi:hypothetical protein
MSTRERVTITLPGDVIREIDRREKNRSRFVLEAVQHEIDRRRREDLRRSLANPHPEGEELAEIGFDEWAGSLPREDVSDLVDLSMGHAVRWIRGEGWVEADE